jgi:hypothetical protein
MHPWTLHAYRVAILALSLPLLHTGIDTELKVLVWIVSQALRYEKGEGKKRRSKEKFRK